MRDVFIFTSYLTESENCFFDFYPEADNQELISYIPSFKHVSSLLGRISASMRYNKMLPLIVKKQYYNLDSICFDNDHLYHILMHTTTLARIDINYLIALSAKHANVRFYVILNDSLNASSVHLKYVRSKLFNRIWTDVFTYDKSDAEEYGFTWIGYNIYSSWNYVEPDAISSDCYYAGYNKGNREMLLLALYDNFVGAGLNARFDIVSDSVNNNSKLVYLNSSLPYQSIVARVKSTNCIIEVLQENQMQQSLRWFEAIAYNKKLLTNNKNIFALPYYDGRYMRYFERVEDIDMDWVSKKESIDYGYHNEFSPIEILDVITKKNMTMSK